MHKMFLFVDDLAESLKDGRYHNQLERMKQLK